MTGYPSDRMPNRVEKLTAIKMGMLAGDAGKGYMDCRFKTDSENPWEREMRSCWVDGWMESQSRREGEKLFAE